MTDKMDARQKARENGKYSKMNRCEVCGKSIGSDYLSDPDCNKTGKGLVLCSRKCAVQFKMEVCLKQFIGPINRTGIQIQVQAQAPKEFMWLFTNITKAETDEQFEKWAQKMRNWVRNHPDLFIDYLTQVADGFSIFKDMFDDEDPSKTFMFWFAKKVKIDIGYVDNRLTVLYSWMKSEMETAREMKSGESR